MILIKLNSDNHNGLFTPKAYETIALQLSTGDHATHQTSGIVVGKWFDKPYYDSLGDELIEVQGDPDNVI